MRIVTALGGNALLDPEREPEYENQRENIEKTARKLGRLMEQGHELVVTHGNGPQVGNIMLQEEKTPPEMPLDVDVAETQGQIGYMLQRSLDRAMEQAGLDADAVTVVSQVVVDSSSKAFEEPSKPVGPFYTAEDAEMLEDVKKVGEGSRPYRRVVPSPAPEDIVEKRQIKRLVDAGDLVIACGGGGIPVTREFEGVEAVVDKDRSAGLLAELVDADVLLISTDVEYVYRDYGGADEEVVRSLSVEEARLLAEENKRGVGSMNPKLEACADFVESTGNKAIIGSVENIVEALDGRGTVIGGEE